MDSSEVNIKSTGTTLACTLLLPINYGKFPCVVIAGGTMTHTRDGQLIDPGRSMPRRDNIKRLAERLAEAGYASIRWDKRGYGSTPASSTPADNYDEARDLMAVMSFVRSDDRFSRLIVFGESAGAYFACLAAKYGKQADAYAFLGALCSSDEELFLYNYGRLSHYAGLSEENNKWAIETCAKALVMGRHYRGLIEAAKSGAETFHISDSLMDLDYRLDRMRHQMIDTPQSLFKYISAPALVIHGELDMNVDPLDAATAESIMVRSGNRDVTRIMVPGADHSFQEAPQEFETRLRERHSFDSFKRPYSEAFYNALICWLDDHCKRME